MQAHGTKVSNDWVEIILGIARFFLEHSEINLNGAEHTASIKYRGPNGWQMSFETLQEADSQDERQFLGVGASDSTCEPVS